MVESIRSAVSAAIAAPQAAPAIAPRKQVPNPDGAAVANVTANYNRPEDLEDITNQTVPDETDSAFFGADGLTFGDLLDIVNPLQHIPVVSTIYRALTGDEISPGARLAGGALFGGPIGLGVAIVNAAVEAANGEDIGDTIMTALIGGDAAAPVQTAATAVSESDPAVIGAGTLRVSMLPQAPVNAPAVAPQQPLAAIPFAGNGLPFGGMGALPFAAGAGTGNDPVAAVLQARSAVPRGGPVAGLGQIGGSSPLPVISTRLSDKLAALAARTAAQTLPPKLDDNKDDRRKSAEPSTAAAPQFAPAGAISQTMLNALDRYQQMKRAENAVIPRG